MNISPISSSRNQSNPNFGMALKITPAAISRLKENMTRFSSETSDRIIKDLIHYAKSAEGDKVDVIIDASKGKKNLVAKIMDSSNNAGFQYSGVYLQSGTNLYETEFVRDAVNEAKRIQHLNESMGSLSKFIVEG